MATATLQGEKLREEYSKFKTENPKVRIRDAAEQLGVSEAELVALECGRTATRLEPKWGDLLLKFQDLGDIMALTRNNEAVIEKDGPFKDVEIGKHASLSLGKIDLRLFLSAWKSGFAVDVQTPAGLRHSFQFFDSQGTAVLKVYLLDNKAQKPLYDELVNEFKSENQSIHLDVDPPRKKEEPVNLEDVDIESFQNEWKALKDTHDFFIMMRKYKLTRLQALNSAPEGFAYQVDTRSLKTILEKAVSNEVPIMVFVGNRGCIEIHSGQIFKLKEMGEWYNILDDGFNLHVKQNLITEAWVVIKPTEDGDVTSLELYNKDGDTIAQLFGERKPGIPELESWRGIVGELTRA